MLRIGLTGGIGSGKTTVARIFEVLGVPVYYADEQAKRLMNENELLRNEIIRLFGDGAYTDLKLNRGYLGGTVFKDPEKLALLNSIVHPVTLLDAQSWMAIQTSPYAIKEAAILFEAGAHKNLDYIIGVFSPADLRIQRIMQRDGLTSEEVSARMSKQMDENIKMKMCDFVLINNEKELLIPQVNALHEKLLAMC